MLETAQLERRVDDVKSGNEMCAYEGSECVTQLQREAKDKLGDYGIVPSPFLLTDPSSFDSSSLESRQSSLRLRRTTIIIRDRIINT